MAIKAPNTISGLDTVLRNLNREILEIPKRTKQGMKRAVALVGRRSQKDCPVVTSNLINSEFDDVFETPGKIVGVIGYTAMYAPFVHENPRAGKTGGISPKGAKYKPPKGSTEIAFSVVGKWKFLEDPLKKSAGEILKILATSARIK